MSTPLHMFAYIEGAEFFDSIEFIFADGVYREVRSGDGYGIGGMFAYADYEDEPSEVYDAIHSGDGWGYGVGNGCGNL